MHSSSGCFLVSGYALMNLHDENIVVSRNTLAAAKAVYLTIAMHVNAAHVCWLSHQTLCKYTHCSPRTVTRGLRYLYDYGYVELLTRGRPGKVNTWRWLNPEELKLNSTKAAPLPGPRLKVVPKSGPVSTRDRSIEEDLMDTSWAYE